MANQRKNNNKMNMNMSRPSMLWLYGLIGAFIIGYYVFGDVNDTPVPSDWATVERMVEKGEVEKIQVVNRDQAQVFLKAQCGVERPRDQPQPGQRPVSDAQQQSVAQWRRLQRPQPQWHG